MIFNSDAVMEVLLLNISFSQIKENTLASVIEIKKVTVNVTCQK